MTIIYEVDRNQMINLIARIANKLKLELSY